MLVEGETERKGSEEERFAQDILLFSKNHCIELPELALKLNKSALSRQAATEVPDYA
jgi:hypothetical protein